LSPSNNKSANFVDHALLYQKSTPYLFAISPVYMSQESEELSDEELSDEELSDEELSELDESLERLEDEIDE